MTLTQIGILACFLAYMVFWIQIPGMLLTATLLPKKIKWSTKLGCGFFMGFSLLAILYYFESLLKLNYVIAVAGPVLSAVAIFIYINRGKPGLLCEGEKVRPSFYIILGILLLVCLLGYYFPYINATSGITTQVYHDMLFHTGNITSLSRTFPNYDIRVSGIMFYYHYFMELFFAMCKHIFGMNAYELYLIGDAPMSAWTLGPALITLGEIINRDKKVSEFKYFVSCMSVFLSCLGVMCLTIRWRWTPVSWGNNHMFLNGNAMGIAVATTIIIIDVVVFLWDSEFKWNYPIAVFLLLNAATGFKGTTGLLLAGIIVSVFVIELLITRKFVLQKLIYSLTGLLSFAVTYVLVVSGFNTNGANNRAIQFSPAGTLKLSSIPNHLIQNGILSQDNVIHVAIMLILGIAAITGPFVIYVVDFGVYKFRELIKTKQVVNILDWYVVGSILISWIGFCFFSIEGLSQGYLVLSVVPLVVYCSYRITDIRSNNIGRVFRKAVYVCGAVLILMDCGLYIKNINTQSQIYRSDDGGRSDLVSKDLMDGYFWLRDNTSENSLLAVDIQTEDLDYREIYFYCSAFSERQCYIEGYDYTDVSKEISSEMLNNNKLFYSNDGDVAEKYLSDCGIDYLVVSMRENPDYISPTEKLTCVYENAAVKIYKYE